MKTKIFTTFSVLLFAALFKTFAADPSSDNTLKSLRLGAHNYTDNYTGATPESVPGFNPSVTNYVVELSFNYDGEVPAITAEKNHSGASVNITNAPSITEEGKTQAVVSVTAQNGDVKDYTVTFVKTKDFISGIYFHSSTSSKTGYESSGLFTRDKNESHGSYWGDYCVRALTSVDNAYVLTPYLAYGADTVSFWVKKYPLGSQNSTLKVQYKRISDADWITKATILSSELTDSWVEKKYELNITDPSVRVRLFMERSVAGSGAIAFYIDDVRVTSKETSSSSDNLIPNGDMSLWNQTGGTYDNVPVLFLLGAGETNVANYFSKATETYNGKNALKMNYKNSSSGSARSFSTLTFIPLEPGVYELSFYLKSKGYFRTVNLARMGAEALTTKNPSEYVLTGTPLSSCTDIPGWTRYSLYYMVSVKDEYRVVFAHNNYDAANTSQTPELLMADIVLKLANSNIPAYQQRWPMPNLNLGPIPIPETQDKWQSDLVKINEEGELTYRPDADGFKIPNFSHAGYKNGDEEIPFVPVVKEISPIEGDNTVHIQKAINEVGAMPLDVNGIRGALLLKKGLYPVMGPINIPFDGIVLRGEGNDENPENSAIIYDWYRDPDGYDTQRNVLMIGKESGNWTTDKKDEENILDDIVPVGAYTVRIMRNENYKEGDVVCIYHPCTEAWLAAVNYGEVGGASFAAQYNWTTSTAPIYYHRYVTKVEHQGAETLITVDAPVFYTLKKSLSQSVIYRDFEHTPIQKSAVENLRIVINSTSEPDEKHAWNCVFFKNTENCWARNTVTAGFGKSGFHTMRSTRITIEDCFAIYPISERTGERMYNYSLSSHSQLILFKSCYANRSRHAFVSNGTSTVSGIVVYKCKVERATARSEGHRMWTQGMLFDTYEDYNPMTTNFLGTFGVLGLFNRWEEGSGHGWAAVNSVLWSCNVRTDFNTPEAIASTPFRARSHIALEKPPTSQNYAVGCFVTQASDLGVHKKPTGYKEGTNTPGLQPASLYQAQLDWRHTVTNTGIKSPSPKTKSYLIYPNPAVDVINVNPEILSSGKCLIEIFSLEGKKALSKEIKTQEEISIKSLSEGVYLVRLSVGNKSYTEKLIVK